MLEDLKVGDDVIRCWPGLREQIERHPGMVVEVTPECITVIINMDVPRTMHFDPQTGIDIYGREYGWLEEPTK